MIRARRQRPRASGTSGALGGGEGLLALRGVLDEADTVGLLRRPRVGPDAGACLGSAGRVAGSGVRTAYVTLAPAACDDQTYGRCEERDRLASHADITELRPPNVRTEVNVRLSRELGGRLCPPHARAQALADLVGDTLGHLHDRLAVEESRVDLAR